MTNSISIEQANQVLFDEDTEKVKEKPNDPPERLLKKMVPQEPLESETIPYYKRPIVQIIAVAALGVPILWGLVNAFSGSSPPETEASTENKQEQLYKESLEEERRKNQALALENAMKKQELEVIPVKQVSSPEPQPKPKPIEQNPKPQPQAVRVQQPQPVRQSVTTTPRVVLPRPQTQPQVVVQQEPSPDPMELWLAQANAGHYLAPMGEPAYVSYSVPETPEPSPVSETIPTAVTLSENKIPGSPRPRKKDNPSVSVSQRTEMAQNYARSVTMLDIGSVGRAQLKNGIAWTQSGPPPRKYLLTLNEPFLNTQGEEILPSGTRVIAEITNASGAGVFFMDVTRILTEEGSHTIPPGAMQIISHDGSPLKAELRKLEDNRFWQDFSAAVAPGVERAMGSLANEGESLILQGNRSVITSSSGNSNPLAAGVSGVANGVSQVLTNQMQQGHQAQPVPYFWFPSGATVQIVVYDDISF